MITFTVMPPKSSGKVMDKTLQLYVDEKTNISQGSPGAFLSWVISLQPRQVKIDHLVQKCSWNDL